MNEREIIDNIETFADPFDSAKPIPTAHYKDELKAKREKVEQML